MPDPTWRRAAGVVCLLVAIGFAAYGLWWGVASDDPDVTVVIVLFWFAPPVVLFGGVGYWLLDR